jgi:hypothetical protein
VLQRPRPDQDQADHRGEADLQRIDHAAAQHAADLAAPALADQAGGHDLHPHHQADGGGDDDGRGGQRQASCRPAPDAE